jgi:hypothetical protein
MCTTYIINNEITKGAYIIKLKYMNTIISKKIVFQ